MSENNIGTGIGFLVVLVLAIAILMGFSYSLVPPTKENIEKLENSPDTTNNATPFLARVGDKLQLEHVKHIEGSRYEIGWINTSGQLVWTKTKDDIPGYTMVVEKENIGKSYIERRKNNLYIDKKGLFGFFKSVGMSSNSYVIYLAEGNLKGGTTTIKDCGKNCIREIQTEIIDNK
jgi:hypothetical protein